LRKAITQDIKLQPRDEIDKDLILEYATLLFDDIEFASVLSLITAAFLAEQPDVWPTPAIAIIAKPSREAMARNYDRSLIRIMPRPPSQKP
jgi:hypothetical protein